MNSSQFKTLALASVIVGLTACGSGSDAPSTSTTDNNFDYYEVVDVGLATSTVNGVTSQTAKLILSHHMIKDNVWMSQETDVITDKIATSYLTTTTTLTKDALILPQTKKVGGFLGDANVNANFTNNVLTLRSKQDSKLSIEITLKDKSISGAKIQDIAELDQFNNLKTLPSAQNSFGNNQYCKAISKTSYSIDHIEFGKSVSDKTQTKADLDKLVALQRPDQTKISGTWQGVDWVAFDVNSNKGYGYGYALYNNKIWNISYQRAGSFTDEPLECTFFTKAQADAITAAAKAAYPQ